MSADRWGGDVRRICCNTRGDGMKDGIKDGTQDGAMVVHDAAGQQIGTVTEYRRATDAANLCKEIVVATARKIGGRDYVQVEGWQAIAVAHGCCASARDVRKIEGGICATGEVRRMSDAVVLATAEGYVGEDETTWAKRPEYAKRAMAQTRAISRACRSAFAHVVVMMRAGLETTPAEEVPAEGFGDTRTITVCHTQPAATQRNTPATPPPVRGTRTEAPAVPASRPLERATMPAKASEPVGGGDGSGDGSDTVRGIVEAINEKSGTRKDGKPWTRYGIKVGGTYYNTFDAAHADTAQRARDDGGEVRITWAAARVGTGRDVVSIVSMAQEAELLPPDTGADDDNLPF